MFVPIVIEEQGNTLTVNNGGVRYFLKPELRGKRMSYRYIVFGYFFFRPETELTNEKKNGVLGGKGFGVLPLALVRSSQIHHLLSDNL